MKVSDSRGLQVKPHLSWIISLPHATTLIKKMNQKKHRNAGYFFELNEQDQLRVWNQPEKMMYADYDWKTVLYRLDIFYEKP